ncbi:MAG: phosphonoacetaldehyde hydrolase [Solirubrobacteraceae bacterium]|nr:phosphonoacetaldehyde hydrolase [Solirubrobacteraceae bacterium]
MTAVQEGARAVVFDWAGTTVDYGCMAPVEAFVGALAAHGVESNEADVRGPMGRGKRDHLVALLSLPAVAAQWADRHGREPSQEDIDALYDEVTRLMAAAALERAEPLPGAVEAVAALRGRGVKIGSCTGYPRGLMDSLALAAAARGYAPDVVLTPDDVPRGRPAPYMCYLNAVLLDTHPLGQMVKVGDTVFDVLEGRAAGMWTVGTLLGGSEVGLSREAEAALGPAALEERLAAARARLLEAGAHYVLRSVAEVPGAVADIDRRLACGERAVVAAPAETRDR